MKIEEILNEIEELPVYLVDTKDDITHWPRPKHAIEKHRVIKILTKAYEQTNVEIEGGHLVVNDKILNEATK